MTMTTLTSEQLQVTYRKMRMIRAFEEKLSELVTAGKLGGFLHLSVGQEAVAAGVCAHLTERDYVATTHRGHGHCIAKGVRVKGMMAELFGRSTGLCKGKGGSMHIADMDQGMLGANGIVGAGIPLATGAALTCKLKKTGGVAVAFFGDGASNQGQFHEALNMASNWKLPAVFVVENNGWGEFTPTRFVVPVEDIAVRADSYAMRKAIADGNDFFDVHEKAGAAVEAAREGKGPTLLECKTYRYLGHYVGDPLAYRSQAEAEEWKTERDAIDRFRARVVGDGLVADTDLRRIDEEVEEELARAVADAESDPMPAAEALYEDVYAKESKHGA
ncbi:MAG: thiamine pyrophosphate-dependent dehydrogenase E1 component subunit alpha [Candidatus Binatia bacterium]